MRRPVDTAVLLSPLSGKADQAVECLAWLWTCLSTSLCVCPCVCLIVCPPACISSRYVPFSRSGSSSGSSQELLRPTASATLPQFVIAALVATLCFCIHSLNAGRILPGVVCRCFVAETCWWLIGLTEVFDNRNMQHIVFNNPLGQCLSLIHI